MDELLRDPGHEVAQTAALIEHELVNGYLRKIALAIVDSLPEDVTPGEIAEVILHQPPKGESLKPRWTLVDEAEAAESTRTAIAANTDRIISTVVTLGLRKILNGERQTEDIDKVDPEKAIFVVEGGANKGSVVRRGVAIKAMCEIYGDNLESETLYQFGSERIISPTRKKNMPGGTTETVENDEHRTICDLAGEFLPSKGSFTEFDATLATALAEGYEISTIHDDNQDVVAKHRIEMHHADPAKPKLVIIQPAGKSLSAGFDAVWSETRHKTQFVIATNGQYREKDVYRAKIWADTNSIDMLPAVALGDEPGDTFSFRDVEIRVPNRPETLYINELIVLYRMAMRQLPDIN
jgi:hypothetical protein